MQKSFGKKNNNNSGSETPMGMIDQEEPNGPDFLMIACIAMVVLAAGLLIYRTFIQSPAAPEPAVIESVKPAVIQAEKPDAPAQEETQLRAVSDQDAKPN